MLLILALMSALMIPRFGGTAKREFDLTVDKVADLLTMLAQRQQLQQNPVGLQYDAVDHALQLVILESGVDDPDVRSRWRLDPFVSSVRLPGDSSSFILEVYADGDYVDIREWPLATTPAEQRPDITVKLEGDEFSAVVLLPSHAIVAERSDQGRSAQGRVDLDAAGRSREDW